MSSMRPISHAAIRQNYVREFANNTEGRIKQVGNALGSALGIGVSAVAGTVSDGLGISVRAAGRIIDTWV